MNMQFYGVTAKKNAVRYRVRDQNNNKIKWQYITRMTWKYRKSVEYKHKSKRSINIEKIHGAHCSNYPVCEKSDCQLVNSGQYK